MYKELEGDKYLLQVWSKGKIIYEKKLSEKIKAWNMSKHNKTLIFLPDKVDEPDRQSYIHWIELNFEEFKASEDCNEKKLLDWTGKCDQLMDQDQCKKEL